MIEPDFSFRNLVYIINKRFKFLLVVGILACIAGYVFTSPYFLKPRFTSSATVYPVNLEPFSEESETEQMLQLFEFSDIKDTLVEKFQMYTRWGLIPGNPEYNYWLDLLYEERVSIRPTKYESVIIECQDESPDTAKLMVEEVIHQYNRLTNLMEQSTYTEYLAMKEKEAKYLEDIMDRINEDLNKVREETGMISLSGQLESLMEGYMNLLEKGNNSKRIEEVSKKLELVSVQGGELIKGRILMENLGLVHAEVLEDLNEAQSYSSRKISYAKFIVKPKVADKKSWPVRWIMFLGIVSSSLFLAIVLFAFVDKRSA